MHAKGEEHASRRGDLVAHVADGLTIGGRHALDQQHGRAEWQAEAPCAPRVGCDLLQAQVVD
jgi:hypothetical protein